MKHEIRNQSPPCWLLMFKLSTNLTILESSLASRVNEWELLYSASTTQYIPPMRMRYFQNERIFVSCVCDGWMNLDGTHTEAPLPHKKLVQQPVRNKLPSQKLSRLYAYTCVGVRTRPFMLRTGSQSFSFVILYGIVWVSTSLSKFKLYQFFII